MTERARAAAALKRRVAAMLNGASPEVWPDVLGLAAALTESEINALLRVLEAVYDAVVEAA